MVLVKELNIGNNNQGYIMMGGKSGAFTKKMAPCFKNDKVWKYMIQN